MRAMHLCGATRGGQRGARVSHGKLGLREARQDVHLECGHVRFPNDLQRLLEMPHRGPLIALAHREQAGRDGSEIGESAVLLYFRAHRGSFGQVSARGVQVPHLDFPECQ